MRLRLAALLALAAAGMHLGVTEPARASLVRAAEQQRVLRAERRELARRKLPLERSEAARTRALAALAASPLPEGHEAHVLRRMVLATLAGEPVRRVRVSVRPGRGALAAGVSLACEGDLDPVLRAVTQLARPGSGLVLARTRLSALASGVALDLEAQGIRPGS